MTAEQENIVREFGLYLEKIKGINKQSRGNYLSWTKFLMKSHDLLAIRTEDDVTRILERERELMKAPDRKVYTKDRDYGNFRSTLNRFLPFMQCHICKTISLKHIVSLDEMIDLIGTQDCAARAQVMNEAIRILAFERNCTLSDGQKKRLKDELAKFGATSNLYFQNFGSGSGATIINT